MARMNYEKATAALEEALNEMNMDFVINEGTALSMSKIDFHLKDSLDRTWQVWYHPVDFQMPERFDMSYIGEDNEKHRPVMVHRTVLAASSVLLAF